MTIAMMVDNPQGSPQIYEQVLEKAGLVGPGGGIVHIAGPSPNGGWRVIELFETPEDAKRFLRERIGPAFQAVGAASPPAPQFWPVHSYLT